jgi:hypothetical protein
MVQRYYTNIIRRTGSGHPTMAEVRDDYARLIAARYGAESILRR